MRVCALQEDKWLTELAAGSTEFCQAWMHGTPAAYKAGRRQRWQKRTSMRKNISVRRTRGPGRTSL